MPSRRPHIAPLSTTMLLCAALGACSDGGPNVGSETSFDTSTERVDQVVWTSCSTNSVRGLSEQIIAESNCIVPGAFTAVPTLPNLWLGGAVFPYLAAPAAARFATALKAYPGTMMSVNSMWRTPAQQYLLYAWYLSDACGIPAAAPPASSNHESGLAIDVEEYDTWIDKLSPYSFSWLGWGDPVHFDYYGQGAVDRASLGVQAFQRLHNRNRPQDRIAEDGAYGGDTEARLKAAPARGFPLGASCAEPPCDAAFEDICRSAFRPEIEWLAQKGIVGGCTADRFCPQELTTRAVLAQVLMRALGLPAGPDAFTDDDGAPFEPAVNALAAAGITSGCDATGKLFCPYAPITRAELAAFLRVALDLPPGPNAFVDDNGSPFESAINAVAAAGITGGCNLRDRKFCPDDHVTREQLAAFIHRALQR